jgi:hypothetical protein
MNNDAGVFIAREELLLGAAFVQQQQELILSQGNDEFIARICVFDVQPLLQLLVARKVCDETQSKVVVVELFRFLLLTRIVTETSPSVETESVDMYPSPIIHAAWQVLILFLSDYIALCGGSLITLITHNPMVLLDAGRYMTSYRTTYLKYTDTFIPSGDDSNDTDLSSSLWPSPDSLQVALSHTPVNSLLSEVLQVPGSQTCTSTPISLKPVPWVCHACAVVSYNTFAPKCEKCGAQRVSEKNDRMEK